MTKLAFSEIPSHVKIIPGFGDAVAGKRLSASQYILFLVLFLCNSVTDLPLEDGKKGMHP